MTSAPVRKPEAMRLLVADDDSEVRQVLMEYLTLRGFEVIEAATGLETLFQVKRGRPSGVVLDLGMPRLGGIDALKRIRAFDPTIRVVVVTAEVDPEVHRRALILGAHAVLPKPVVLSDLLAALQSPPPESSSGPVIHDAAAPAPAAPPVAASAARVLVVDDDAEIRAVLEEFLVLGGYQVSTAEDGATAVRRIVEAPPDVVLLDIHMPGLSGTDALPSIRAVAPRAVVIMVSGTGDVDLAKRSLAAGAFDYVVKPVDLNYLTESLEAALTMTGPS